MAEEVVRALAKKKTEVTGKAARTDASEPVNQQVIAVLAYQFSQERGWASAHPTTTSFGQKTDTPARSKQNIAKP